MNRPLLPFVLLGLLLLLASPAEAQDGNASQGGEADPVEGGNDTGEDSEDGHGQIPGQPRGIWPAIVGSPEPSRLYVGKAALHLERMDEGLSWHPMVGVSWRGFFLKTFVNTHEGRTWAGGVGRGVLGAEGSDYAVRLGYRLGVVRGYDARLMRQAEEWPVLPAGQVVLDARVRGVGVQFAWVWIVSSMSAFVEFD
jgi:hypothetical protein